MRILAPMFFVAVGAFGAYSQIEAMHPGEGITRQAVTNNVNAAAPMAQGAGVMGGALLRAGAPVIAGGKDLLQQSGLGELLTPPADGTEPGGIAPPQGQPAPGTQP